MGLLHEFSDDNDLERVFRLPATTYIGGNDAALPLKEIIRRLEATTISFTFILFCLKELCVFVCVCVRQSGSVCVCVCVCVCEDGQGRECAYMCEAESLKGNFSVVMSSVMIIFHLFEK